MTRKSPMKKFKPKTENLVDSPPKKPKRSKDTKPIIDYVLSKLGTPENLVKVEAIHYDWGEGRDNRWRVNIVTEEMLDTELGNSIPTWKRPDSFFMHFDDDMGVATYCNPSIERKYE